ncbi:MAG: DUF4349 domain-containing protein [Burkholderiales bacterium]|nr:DUF4349 domain-containing protein [Burkholderiales bacterium]
MRTISGTILLLMLMAGCGEKYADSGTSKNKLPAPLETKIMAEVRPSAPSAGPPDEKKYRAIRQYLALELLGTDLQSAWRAAHDDCAMAPANQCDILISTISQGELNTPSAASLQIRIAPQRHDGYRKKVLARGELREDRTESLDKTSEVIDTEARLKNTLALRDRLRAMLATPGAKFKDLIDLEKELARVQSELDSLNGIRKALANETEKTFMQIDFRAKRSMTETGTFSPIGDAFAGSGRAFASSLASLIVFVVVALPWVIPIIVVFIIARSGLRAFRNRKIQSKP